jgi:hypothetical protein
MSFLNGLHEGWHWFERLLLKSQLHSTRKLSKQQKAKVPLSRLQLIEVLYEGEEQNFFPYPSCEKKALCQES